MWEDLRTRVASSLRGPAQIALRSVWSPARSEYLGAAAVASPEPATVLRAMLGDAAVDASLALPDLTAVGYSARWQVDRGALTLLSAFVRSTRPERMLETGVADGASTRIVLDAMEANGVGRLDSVDVSPSAGALARSSPAAHRWNFTALPARGRAAAFRRVVRSVPALQGFLHDSDHSYPWQSFEYREAWEALVPGGWMLSDDIDASYAFLDFARAHGTRPWVLVGPEKLFGALRKDR